MPARIETDEPGIARPLERANAAARRQEAQHRDDAHTEPRQSRVEGEGD